MRRYLAILIAFVPFNFIRIFFYRRLLGYKVSSGAKISALTLIDANSCEIGRVTIGPLNYISVKKLILKNDVTIGRLNRFKWIGKLYVEEVSSIVSGNVAFGSRPGISPFESSQNFYIGKKCIITNKHLFDISDELKIGDDVTIGGTGTQFWTHSFDLQHIKIQAGIKIGNQVYIGSRCLILGGVSVADNVIIGAGTNVSRSISRAGFYVSSELVRKGDVQDYMHTGLITNFKDYKFARRTNSSKIKNTDNYKT